jgi:hypothetical protein
MILSLLLFHAINMLLYDNTFYSMLCNTLWHVGPLLGNHREISNYTTAVAKKRLRKRACFHGNKRIQQ